MYVRYLSRNADSTDSNRRIFRPFSAGSFSPNHVTNSCSLVHFRCLLSLFLLCLFPQFRTLTALLFLPLPSFWKVPLYVPPPPPPPSPTSLGPVARYTLWPAPLPSYHVTTYRHSLQFFIIYLSSHSPLVLS